MSSRKRSFSAVDGGSDDAEPSLLHRVRNMWQFANLCQWIYTFGKAAKIDESIEVEEIEAECLKPKSPLLDDIALALLKLVSSHRGLTHQIFDEMARRQYLAKDPDHNPFGHDDDPAKFSEFDVFTKLRILQQLTQWIMIHPERIRDKMEEQKDIEQASWRIEPYGWDAEDRTYFVLDDNRVYRLTEAPPPPPTKPKKPKGRRAGRRSSKRQRMSLAAEDEADQEGVADVEHEQVDDGLGGMTWECIAVSLGDVRSFLDGLRKTRDENEKVLRSQLEDYLVPILEKQEESRKRKELQRERELLNLAKMANAKRSTRIASKAEHLKEEEKAKEEEQQRREAEAARRKEEAAEAKAERERNRRLASRENRLQEREARRLLHEEELAQLSEDSKNMSSGEARISERRLKAEIEKNKQALADLEQEEEGWVFDCVCGLYGQVDDGTHSVACENCNIWQHSKCLGIKEEDAERPEFRFICASCTRREQESKAHPRPIIKLKVHNPQSSRARPETTEQNEATTNDKPSTIEHPQEINTLQTGATTNPLSPVVLEPGLTPPVSFTNGAISPSKATPGAQNGSTKVAPEGRIQLTPSPVKLTPGRGPDGLGIISTSPTATGSPTNGMQSLQGDRSIESTLSTPHISRDIYRAAYLQNGTLPAQAGLSPTKHSPPRPTDQRSATAGLDAAAKILISDPSARGSVKCSHGAEAQ
ncbi:hypothetical protein G7046_g4577 [Stylonectria norvegica]|nr:hypothetical protein G7046_g4577 [Stylonectria norvegica]